MKPLIEETDHYVRVRLDAARYVLQYKNMFNKYGNGLFILDAIKLLYESFDCSLSMMQTKKNLDKLYGLLVNEDIEDRLRKLEWDHGI